MIIILDGEKETQLKTRAAFLQMITLWNFKRLTRCFILQSVQTLYSNSSHMCRFLYNYSVDSFIRVYIYLIAHTRVLISEYTN